MKPVFCLSLLFLVIAQCAFAAKTQAPLKVENKTDFEKVVAQVRAEMAPEGRFGTLSNDERENVNGNLKTMSALFDRTPDIANMSETDRRTMFNAQEAVNAALLKRDGDRLICAHEARSGSHLAETRCRTARDIDRDRRQSQEWMRGTMQQTKNTRPGGN